MKRLALLWLLACGHAALAQPAPELHLALSAEPVPAMPGGWPACDADDIPDAPARALRLADGSVQLYASDQINRTNAGPDLLHLRHDCAVVYRGKLDDDPAAFDDRSWIASVWTDDGKTILAILHNEFHGHRRPGLCPSGRYIDCWYNTLTFARSRDAGRTFQRDPGDAIVAVLPYRYDQYSTAGHRGYFNPSNIVRHDAATYMLTFATRVGEQREGNCLLRTDDVAHPGSWRGWDGTGFTTTFENPYRRDLPAVEHVCAPVGVGSLRWPVTSLIRHAPSGRYVALMQNTAQGGGVFYSTSRDLLHWSGPAHLLSASGPASWRCGDGAPILYPSLLDPASDDRNFQTIGASAELFATQFAVADCRLTRRRTLLRWHVEVTPADR